MLWWPVIITRYNSSTQIICIDMYRDRARVKVMVRVNVQGKRELWETGCNLILYHALKNTKEMDRSLG